MTDPPYKIDHTPDGRTLMIVPAACAPAVRRMIEDAMAHLRALSGLTRQGSALPVSSETLDHKVDLVRMVADADERTRRLMSGDDWRETDEDD